MDEELKQLDLATADSRRRATAALDALRGPQRALREAAAEYVASVAARRLDASRRTSVEVMARLSDDELAELRLWTDERIAEAREAVTTGIESCDLWIPETPGLSPADVTTYSGGLMARPKDGRTGIPQALVQLFEDALAPLRRGLAAIGLILIPADAEPAREVAVLRAWQAYRDAAVEAISRWADVDEHYHASAERFQEMRWELAGDADPDEVRARLESDQSGSEEESVAELAEAAAKAPTDAVVRLDSETLVPMSR